MKIMVYNPAEQDKIRRFVARLEYVPGEGAKIVVHQYPVMSSAELHVLAAALVTAADGLESGDDPERVRERIEAVSAPVSAQAPTRYRYRCTHRPPTEDAIPPGAVQVECAAREFSSDPFGYVTYTAPLPARDAYRYDLEQIAPPLSMPVYPVGTWVKNMNTGKQYSVELIDGEYWIGDEIMETPRDFRIYEPLDPQPEAVPEDVIEGLLVVRETGLCNMFDPACVLDVLEDQNFHSAVEWLENNATRFVEALNLMGKRVGK